MNRMEHTAALLAPRRFQPRNGPSEHLAYINRPEADLLRNMGGSGRMTRHGVPSYSYEDSHPSNNSYGGGNYNYSSTGSGQGNYNTGGSPTGYGSFANGIVGNQPQYNVAPSSTGFGAAADQALTQQWQAKVAQNNPNPSGMQSAPQSAPYTQTNLPPYVRPPTPSTTWPGFTNPLGPYGRPQDPLDPARGGPVQNSGWRNLNAGNLGDWGKPWNDTIRPNSFGPRTDKTTMGGWPGAGMGNDPGGPFQSTRW